MAACEKGCGKKATRRGMCHSCYECHRHRQIAYGRWETSYVHAEPVRQHILRLKAQGMGDRRIAELSGVNRGNVREVLTGRPGRSPAEKLLRRNAEAILAVEPNLAPGTFVDACGTVRRLRALVAIGYTQNYLCGRFGVLPGNGCQIFRGNRTFVTASTAKRVADLFDELSMTPGPSRRARNHAATNRWAPPLAWDDDTIDNPDAKPDLGEQRSTPWDEKYRELRDLGFNDLQILNRFGVKAESMLRQLDRYGITAQPELVKLATSEKWKAKSA